LLSLDENEAYRNLAFLGRGGRLFVNADPAAFPRPEVRAYLEKNEITYHAIPAGPLALELGNPRSANLALIGFMAAQNKAPFDAAELRGTIERISPEPFKAANLKVFEAGAAWEKQ
jgi:Pyruvate/2-oxoacid:ferredoxin oxidoreductase gamma subunit